jgi:hypothetical protein
VIVDGIPIKKWEHVKRDLRPQWKKDIEHDQSYNLVMMVEDINICDIEIHGVEYDMVTHEVKIDCKSQEWKFCGAAANYYRKREHAAYTAATVHRDLIERTR